MIFFCYFSLMQNLVTTRKCIVPSNSNKKPFFLQRVGPRNTIHVRSGIMKKMINEKLLHEKVENPVREIDFFFVIKCC